MGKEIHKTDIIFPAAAAAAALMAFPVLLQGFIFNRSSDKHKLQYTQT